MNRETSDGLTGVVVALFNVIHGIWVNRVTLTDGGPRVVGGWYYWCSSVDAVNFDSPSLIEVCDDAVDSLSVRLCLEGGWLVE